MTIHRHQRILLQKEQDTRVLIHGCHPWMPWFIDIPSIFVHPFFSYSHRFPSHEAHEIHEHPASRHPWPPMCRRRRLFLSMGRYFIGMGWSPMTKRGLVISRNCYVRCDRSTSSCLGQRGGLRTVAECGRDFGPKESFQNAGIYNELWWKGVWNLGSWANRTFHVNKGCHSSLAFTDFDLSKRLAKNYFKLWQYKKSLLHHMQRWWRISTARNHWTDIVVKYMLPWT